VFKFNIPEHVKYLQIYQGPCRMQQAFLARRQTYDTTPECLVLKME